MAQQQNPQQNAAAETEQDINILKKIRMDKLAELQAAGNDPFTITKYDVTAHAADLKADYEATEARLKEAANGDEEAFQASLEPLKEQIVSIAYNFSFSSSGRSFGFFCNASASAPHTTGVAIEVPLFLEYSAP